MQQSPIKKKVAVFSWKALEEESESSENFHLRMLVHPDCDLLIGFRKNYRLATHTQLNWFNCC